MFLRCGASLTNNTIRRFFSKRHVIVLVIEAVSVVIISLAQMWWSVHCWNSGHHSCSLSSVLIWLTPIWLQALGQSENFTHCTVEAIWLLPWMQCLGNICFLPLNIPGTSKSNQPEYSGMILNVPARVSVLSSWISLSVKLEEKPGKNLFSLLCFPTLITWRSIHREEKYVPQKIDANDTNT